MGVTFDTLAKMLNHGFDDVIDVRSPAEFEQDHIPGAINLPALSNDERAQIGTIYVQDDPFKARKLGAALVARNAARHLEGPLADKSGGWRPLVYCWRGGQRSGSFTSILQQIGWRAEVVSGGYQSFRSLVHQTVYDTPVPHKIVLIDGNTGTGKTEILKRVAQHGVQTIDLEGLANHRGSLLGAQAGPQPSQKAFETALACALVGLDPNTPTLLEAESSKVGTCIIPPTLWAAMTRAPRIVIEAPVAARATYLAQAYSDLTEDRSTLVSKLDILRRHQGKKVDGWIEALHAGQMQSLAAQLIEDHYDPAYRASRARHRPDIRERFVAQDLGSDGLDDLTRQVFDWVIKQS